MLYLLLLTLPHAVDVQCKVQGEHLVIEAYYDDDTPAQEAKVEVVDAAGTVVASGRTDDKGVLRLARPGHGTYTVRVDAGAGHRVKKSMTIGAAGVAPTPTATSPTPPSVIVSEGPSREEATQFPWLRVGLGLGLIGVVCAVLWVRAQSGKGRTV